MTPDFKPSEVRMWRGALPLIATFGRAETEMAAALMVIACVFYGDEWASMTPPQIGIAMKTAALEGGCLHELARNPFFPRPDMHTLVAKGFAEFVGDPSDNGAPIQFTEKGFEMLRTTVAKK